MKKLSGKTIFYWVAGSVITLILMDWYIWNHTKAFLINDIRNTLSKKMSFVKKQIDLKAFLAVDQEYLNQLARTIKSTTELRTTLIDKRGVVLADSEVPSDRLNTVENHLQREEVQEALRTGFGLATRKSATIQEDLIYYCEPLKIEGRIIGFIRFAIFPFDFNRKLSFVSGLILRINLAFLGVIMLGAFLYARWLRKNLQNFRKSIVGFSDSHPPEKLPNQSIEEFAQLADEIHFQTASLVQQAEDLRKANAQLHNIFNTLMEGVAAFDAHGHTLIHNSAFAEILHIQERDINQRPYYDWLHFPPVIQDIEHYLTHHQPIKKRTKYYGDSFIEYEILPVVSTAKEVMEFLLVVRDVTQLQRMEAIRKDFVANVSHEFKTPLTSIRGYAETLLSGMTDQPELRDRFLRKIIKQTMYLENLVLDLLQLSRIEKKEIEKLQLINPYPIFEEIAEEFQSLAHAKNLEFVSEIEPPETPVSIEADENLIHTLISNLLRNAIQYNKPEGKIWFRVKPHNGKIRIEVEDTGIGIPVKMQNRIFQRFYRLKEAQEIYSHGSGLGLSIVKHISELLKGAFGVRSKVGEGSLFWVEIPVE
ncbi:MAG: ATP-binding protein [Calditrichia bacterium]